MDSERLEQLDDLLAERADLRTERDEAIARVRRLESALRPFASIAQVLESGGATLMDDAAFLSPAWATITVGQLRVARAALTAVAP